MIVKRVLVLAFALGVFWDMITTYLGTLIILGTQNFITGGIAIVGTAMVVALNFSTKAVWQTGARRNIRFETFLVRFILLRLAWVLAVIYDLWTSLTCNALYVLLPTAPDWRDRSLLELLSLLKTGQLLVILFVTVLTVISPIVFGHLSGLETDILD